MHIQGVVIVTPRQPDAKALAAEWLVMTTKELDVTQLTGQVS
jgi:hypothetical protein